MTATRSYKKPMSARAAREELTRSAGSHFDPAIVRAFLSMPIGRVSWSPKNDWLVFSLAPGGGMNTQVYVVRADGTGLKRLTDGGRERTEREFSDLFSRADLHLARIVSTQSDNSILEVAK